MPEGKQEIIEVIVIGTIVFLLVGVFVVSFLFFHRQKQKVNQLEKMRMQSNFEEELLRTQLEIQEQTLKTISQEIHDNIGQMLSLAKLNLALADEESQPPVQLKVHDSYNLVSKAIQDLRDLSRSLNTDYVSEMGLHRSIEYELEMINKTGVMKATLHAEGDVRKLDPQKELILFRIIQESLNNIIKHSNASNINVVMNYTPTLLAIIIRDNGRGVDLTPLNDATTSGFGLGIRNMHNRASLIGANFNMTSTVGQGTEVSLQLPTT